MEVYSLETPAFRPVQVIPFHQNGSSYLLIQDPTGILEEPVVLVPDAILITLLQVADGKRNVGSLAELIRAKTDMIVTADKVRHVLQNLDRQGLLQSKRFQAMVVERESQYRHLEARPSLLFQSGTKLEAAAALRQEIERHFKSDLSPPSNISLPEGRLRGILAPHIDYYRGGEAYAWAYQVLAEASDATTFIVLGTLHSPSDEYFILTEKPFETILGTVEVDQKIAAEIDREYSGALHSQEYLHAAESTIELQVTYLQYMMKDRPFKIVPILVGGFEDYLYASDGVYPSHDQKIQDFAEVLRQTLSSHEDVAVIGGVDFAHCGPEFGDDAPNTIHVEVEVEHQDREMLKEIVDVNPDAFFDHFRSNKNKRRVCSIAPIYTILTALQGDYAAKMLTYQQANDKKQSCMVTFGSVAFLEKTS